MASEEFEECTVSVESLYCDATKEEGVACDEVAQAATSKSKAAEGSHVAGLSNGVDDVLFDDLGRNAMEYRDLRRFVS